jgi:2,5-diketo-D-gluconate reductase A
VQLVSHELTSLTTLSIQPTRSKLKPQHIDTAEFYANHLGIAAGLQAAGVDRSTLFITDKVAPTKGTDFSSFKNCSEVKEACKEHCEKLGITYMDLYLIHHGMGGKDVRLDQWKAMCELKKEGMTKYAGVSNFSIKHLEEIKAAGMAMPDANQIEIHPLCLQTELVKYCKENGILSIAYSSLAPASSWRVEPGQGSAKEEAHGAKCGEYIKTLVEKYSVTEAQILLKWALQHGYPILPKSSQEARIAQNADLFGFEIAEVDMTQLDSFDENLALAWPAFIGNPLNAE